MKSHSILALALIAIPVGAWSADRHGGWTSVQQDRQPQVVGNGQVIRQVRQIAGVDAIALTGASEVIVQIGPAASLTIEAESNILPLLTSDTRGGTLTIGSRGSYRTRHTPRYYVTLPRLDALGIEGSGDADIRGLSDDRLSLAITGSGDIRASGRVRRLDASIRGSGDMALRGLAVGDADVSIHGSGNLTVAASGRVAARSFGSGDIELIGKPASLDVQKAGSGSVRTVGR